MGDPARRPTLRRRLAALALGSACALGMAEGVVRLQLRTDLFAVRVPGSEVVMHPEAGGLAGIEGTSIQRITSLGLRGRERAPDDALSVLCVGGSTTACEYLSDGETWPDLLGKELSGSVGEPVVDAASGGRLVTVPVSGLEPRADYVLSLDGFVGLDGSAFDGAPWLGDGALDFSTAMSGPKST